MEQSHKLGVMICGGIFGGLLAAVALALLGGSMLSVFAAYCVCGALSLVAFGYVATAQEDTRSIRLRV